MSPADYTGLVKLIYDWQTLIAGAMAVAAAVGTIVVTRATARQQVAAANRQTEAVKEQNDDLRRRHEDEFKPVCMLVPYDGVDPWHKRDTLLATYDDPSATPGYGIIELRCNIRNVGSGPALNVAIRFRFRDMSGFTTAPWELSPLYAGESRGSENIPLRIPILLNDRFNNADFLQVAGKPWEIIIVYEDVFGNCFHSVHYKSPIQLDQYYSNQPIAVPQPWVTIEKGRFPG